MSARHAQAERPAMLRTPLPNPPDSTAHVGQALSAGGGALSPPVRADMESRFGRDFGAVRVHNDAAAHDSARALRAAAYTVGDHIVFGAGRYAPETPSGQHLLAHELAHTVQQSGLQRRGLAGLETTDHPGLEAEADRAADAAMRGTVPTALTTLNQPRISRVDEAAPAGAGPSAPAQDPANAALKDKLKDVPDIDEVAESPGTGKGKRITVTIGKFSSDKPKGKAARINALLKQRADANSLVYVAPVAALKVTKVVKETDADTKFYTTVWLSKYGLTSLQDLSAKLKAWRATDAGKADANGAHIDQLIKVFGLGLLKGSLDNTKAANVDHMVEKQIQGQSVAENMQLLNAGENQAAGSALNAKIVERANLILTTLADSKVDAIALRFRSLTYDSDGVADGVARIEELLQTGALKVAMSAADLEGELTELQSGGSKANIRIGKGNTAIADYGSNDLARYLVPTLDLRRYNRKPGAPAAVETITAGVNPTRLSAIIPKPGAQITVQAETSSVANAAPAGDATAPPAAGPAPGPAAARKLSLAGKQDYQFVFPYLSPGTLNRFELDSKGDIIAHGTITPSLAFLKQINVKLEGGNFGLVADLGPDNFKSPFEGLRVTEAALKLDLAPEFKPSGTFGFEVGPKGKPYVLGKVTAGLEGGAFAATGTLTGQNIPGVDNASGKVRYSALEGWSGEVNANTSKIPRTKQAQVTFGFRTAGGATHYYANGGISFDIGNGKDLTINAAYAGGHMVYTGRLVWEKPIKLVDRVTLGFYYDGDTLEGTGKVPVTYTRSGATFTGDFTVTYRRKGDAEGRISGTGKLGVKTPKLEGSLTLNVNDHGAIWGEGSVAYQINDKLRPTIGVRLGADGKITLLGKIEITKPIELFPPKGGERDLIKIKLDFIIPGPFPGLADPMVHLGAGVRFTYGIGPGQIVNTVIEGSFDPFEDDKNAQLKFTSTFQVPAHVGLTGILEAGLGIAVLGGIAAKVHGGLRIEPTVTLKLAAEVPVTAEYKNGDFSFEGRFELSGGLSLALAIKLYAHVEAFAGLAEKDFDYTLKNYSYDVGQQMKLTLAKLGYSTATGVKWPSLDDIRIEPGNVDPIPMIRQVAQSAKSALLG